MDTASSGNCGGAYLDSAGPLEFLFLLLRSELVFYVRACLHVFSFSANQETGNHSTRIWLVFSFLFCSKATSGKNVVTSGSINSSKLLPSITSNFQCQNL